MSVTGWGTTLSLSPEDYWAAFEESLQKGYDPEEYHITHVGKGRRVISTFGDEVRHMALAYDPFTGMAMAGSGRATQQIVPTFGASSIETSLPGAMAGLVGRMIEAPKGQFDLSKSLDPYSYQASQAGGGDDPTDWTGGPVGPEYVGSRRAQRLLPAHLSDPTHVSPWSFLQQATSYPRAVPTVSGLLRQAVGLHTGAQVTDVEAFQYFPGMEAKEVGSEQFQVLSTYPGAKPREKMMGNLGSLRTFHIMPTGGRGEDIGSSKLRGAEPLFTPTGREIPGIPGVRRQVEFSPGMLIPGAGQSYAQSSAFKDLELMQVKSQEQPLDYGMMRQFGEQVAGRKPMVTLATTQSRLGPQETYLNVLGQPVGLDPSQRGGTQGFRPSEPTLWLGYGPETGSILQQYAGGMINDLRGQGFNVSILNVTPGSEEQMKEYGDVITQLERMGVHEKLVGPGIGVRFDPSKERAASLQYKAEVYSPWTSSHSLGLQATKTVPQMMADLTDVGAAPGTSLVIGGESVKGPAYLVDLLANTLTPKQWEHFGLTPGTFDEQGIMRWGAGSNVLETVNRMFADEGTLASMLRKQGGNLETKWIRPPQDPSTTGMFAPGGKFFEKTVGPQRAFEWRGSELWQQTQVITGQQILTPTESPQREKPGMLNLQDILNAERNQPGVGAAFYENVGESNMPYAQIYMAAFGILPKDAGVVSVKQGDEFGLPLNEARALAAEGLKGELGQRYAEGSLAMPPMEYIVRAMAQSEHFAGKFTEFQGTGPDDPTIYFPPASALIADQESGGMAHFGLTGEPVSREAIKMMNVISQTMGGTGGMAQVRREYQSSMQEFATQPGVIKGAATGSGMQASVSGRLTYVGDLGLGASELGLVVSDDVYANMQQELAGMGMEPTNENIVGRFMRHPGGVLSGAENLIGKIFSASEAASIAKSRGGAPIDPSMHRGVGITSGGVASLNAYDVDKDIGLVVATIASAFPGLQLDNDLQKTFIEGAKQVYPQALVDAQQEYANQGMNVEVANLSPGAVLSHAGKGAGEYGKALEAVEPAIAFAGSGGLREFVSQKFGDVISHDVSARQETIAMSALGKQMIGMSNNFAALMSYALDESITPGSETALSRMGLIKQSLVDTEGLATPAAKELTSFNALSRAAGSLFLPMTPNMWARSSNRSSDITVSIFGQFTDRQDRLSPKREAIPESNLLTAWAPAAMKYGGLTADDIITMLGGDESAKPVATWLRDLETSQATGTPRPNDPFVGADQSLKFREWFRSTPMGGTAVYGQAAFKAMNYALEVEDKVARGEPVEAWMVKRAAAVRENIESGEWDTEIESFMRAQATLGSGQNARLVRDQAAEFGGMKQFRYGGDLIAAMSRQVEVGKGTSRDIIAQTPLGKLDVPFEKPSKYMLNRQAVLPGVDPQGMKEAPTSGITVRASDIGKDLVSLLVSEVFPGDTASSRLGGQLESALYAMRPGWENEGTQADRNEESELRGTIGGVEVKGRKDLWKYLDKARTRMELEDLKSGNPDYFNEWQLRAYKMIQEAMGVTVESMGFRHPTEEGRAALKAGKPQIAAESALDNPLQIVLPDDPGTIEQVHKTARMYYQRDQIKARVKLLVEESFASGRARPDDYIGERKLIEDVLANIMNIAVPERQAVDSQSRTISSEAEWARAASGKDKVDAKAASFRGARFAHAFYQGRPVDFEATLGPMERAITGIHDIEDQQAWLASGMSKRGGMSLAQLKEFAQLNEGGVAAMSRSLGTGLAKYVEGLNQEMPEQARMKAMIGQRLFDEGMGAANYLSPEQREEISARSQRMTSMRAGTFREPLGPGIELSAKTIEKFTESLDKATESVVDHRKNLDAMSKVEADRAGITTQAMRKGETYGPQYQELAARTGVVLEDQARLQAAEAEFVGGGGVLGGGGGGGRGGVRGAIGGMLGGVGASLGDRFGPGKKALTFFDLMYFQRVGQVAWGGMQKSGQEVEAATWGAQTAAFQAGMGGPPDPSAMMTAQADMQRARWRSGEAFNQAWAPAMGAGAGLAGAVAGPAAAIAGPAIGIGMMARYLLPKAPGLGIVAGIATAAVGMAGYAQSQSTPEGQRAIAIDRIAAEQSGDMMGGWWAKLRARMGAHVSTGFALRDEAGYEKMGEYYDEYNQTASDILRMQTGGYSQETMVGMSPAITASAAPMMARDISRMNEWISPEMALDMAPQILGAQPGGISQARLGQVSAAIGMGLPVIQAGQRAWQATSGRPWSPGVAQLPLETGPVGIAQQTAFGQFGAGLNQPLWTQGLRGFAYNQLPQGWGAGDQAQYTAVAGVLGSRVDTGAMTPEAMEDILRGGQTITEFEGRGIVRDAVREFTPEERRAATTAVGYESTLRAQGMGDAVTSMGRRYGPEAILSPAYAQELKAFTTSPVFRSGMAMDIGRPDLVTHAPTGYQIGRTTFEGMPLQRFGAAQDIAMGNVGPSGPQGGQWTTSASAWQQSFIRQGVAADSGLLLAGMEGMPGGGMEDPITGEMVGGTRGMELYNREQRHAAQMGSVGIQAEGLALKRMYMTGQGMPGGRGFWQIQDDMRDLSRRQQDYGWEMQGRRMDMQQTQFAENQGFAMMQAGTQADWQRQDFATQAGQTQIQRAWSREDWQMSDQQRGLQWGWQMEDMEENIRMTTGRQRRKAVQGRERAVTMRNLQEEQIDTQRERQEETEAWQDEAFEKAQERHEQGVEWQDQNFERSRRHFNESMSLSEEDHKKSMEFMKERRKLEDEQTEMQREFTLKQMDLQGRSIGLQAQQIKLAQEWEIIQDTMRLENETEAAAAAKSMNDTLVGALAHVQYIGYVIRNFKVPGGGGGGGGGGGNGDGDIVLDPKTQAQIDRGALPEQFGGRVFPRAMGGGVDPRAGYWVGEAGAEFFQPDRPGTIIPSANTSPMIGVALNAGDASGGGHPLGGAIGAALGGIGNATEAVVVLQAIQELVETVDNVDPNSVKRVNVLLDTLRS